MMVMMMMMMIIFTWWSTDINLPSPEFFFPTGSFVLPLFMTKPARNEAMKVRVFRGMILWASDVQWALKSISLTFSNVSLFSARLILDSTLHGQRAEM